ncbi:Inner membrane protein YphA [Planctomycetes bacterium Pan216]|uniref:Inner membrane protein YphA n=1 Tax=Kolteria novifilia TaxID=2527975 RepID=A0A518BA06_9BACT|nr:Inner membrane protein YphA [Planctomycetes bacterium Pan216]
MVKLGQGLATLVGRLMLAAIFLLSGIKHLMGFSGSLAHLESHGITVLPTVQLAIAITALICGASTLILGWCARFGAFCLILFLIPATLVFHDFWAVPAEQVQMQTIQFLKNVGLMGAMLLVIGFGPGPWSVDECCRGKSAPAAVPEQETP